MCIKPAILILLLAPVVTHAAQSCQIEQAFTSVTALLHARHYRSAANELDRIRGCDNLSAVQKFQLGWLYGRARSFKTALEIFEAVPSDIPDRQTHAYAIALSKFELGDYQGCLSTLKKVQAQIDLNANAQNLLAVSYSKLGLYQQAYVVLSKEIQRDPTELTAYLNVITVCAEGGDFNKAIEFSSRAVELFPKSSEVFIVRGAAETLIGQLDPAYQDFSTAARLSPDRPDARFFIALIDYKQGKFSAAASVLKSAQNAGLVDSDLDYLMAECLLKIDPGSPAPALRYLDSAIRLNPESASARTLRGKLLLDGNQPGRALEDLQIATRRDPSSRSAIYNLARAYRTVGKEKEAQALFRQLKNRTTEIVSEAGDARLAGVLTRSGDLP